MLDITADTVVTDEDTPVTTSVLANDTFEGTPVVTAVTPGTHGTVVNNGDGTVTYTPDANYHGPDSYTYTVASGGVMETTTVSITVNSVNDSPVAINDSGRSPDGRPVTIAILGNDSDPDGDTLTVTRIAGVALPPGGSVNIPEGVVTLNANGTITFTSKAGFQGQVVFPYEISDGHGGSATANVSIAVAPAVDVFPTAPMPKTPLWILPPIEINPIPFVPAVFVSEVVQGFQGDRAATEPFTFSDPRAVRYGEIESSSIGASLGFDPALFVQHAVRASQWEGTCLDNVVDGRTIRINLSSERLIPTPELALPNAGLVALQTPVADRISEPGPEVPVLALARPPDLPGHLNAGSEQPAPAQRAAPSFSEQLRRSGSRTSVAGRDTLHSIGARPPRLIP